MDPSPPTLFVFGDFTLDPTSLELHHRGRPRALEPLPATILVRLVERAGCLVSRRELRELGWPRLPDAAEASLNTCLRQIRAALADDPAAPRYVETLRGRGYRFVHEVHRARSGPPWRRRRVRARFAAAAIGAVIAAGAGAWLALSAHGSGGAAGAPPDDARTGLLKARWMVEQRRDWPAALATVEDVLADHPELAPAHGLRAEALVFLGRHDEAWSAGTRALRLDSDEPTGLRAVGLLRMFAGHWREAELSLRDAVRHDPQGTESLLALAYLHTVLGRFGEADATMQEALRLDPLSPLVRGDIGIMYLWAGSYERARGACAEAVELDPEAYWAAECAFDAARLAGQAAEAAEWARRALAMVDHPAPAGEAAEATVGRYRALRVSARLDAEPGPPSFGLALALADVGRVEEAARALERALEPPGFGVLALAVDPRLARLREHPGYRSVLRRLQLDVAVNASG